MARHNDIGNYGEWLAHKHLLSSGYSILDRNWRFSKAEIDIICLKADVIIFCEVKCRSNICFGDPESFVTGKKEVLMFDAANAYMDQYHLNVELRFDIIAIRLHSKRNYEIKHFKDVFFPGVI